MSLKHKEIFNLILKSLPKQVFSNNEGLFEAAIDIYLTWIGLRPACIPFDGENDMHKYMSSSKGKKCLEALKKIPNINVIIGPYYDSGYNVIVIYNTNMKVEPILENISNIRTQMEQRMDSSVAKKYTKLKGNLHILMGELLGYQCPMNISKMSKKENEMYSISYIIKNKPHLSNWCKISKENIVKATSRLEDIKKALSYIDINDVKLQIEIEKP